jgi:hypothetical protein
VVWTSVTATHGAAAAELPGPPLVEDSALASSVGAPPLDATVPPMPESRQVVLVPLPAPLLSGACGLVLVAVAHRHFRARRYRARG